MRKLACTLLIFALLAAPAAAACYQYVGCTDEDELSYDDLVGLGCTALWELRNQIFHEHGYCFKTQRAISFFGEDGCRYDDAKDIEFSSIEQRNIDTIVRAEKYKGC